MQFLSENQRYFIFKTNPIFVTEEERQKIALKFMKQAEKQTTKIL